MSAVMGAVIRTASTGPRVELDAEGSWYCDDEAGVRIPYADYVAITAPLVERMLGAAR